MANVRPVTIDSGQFGQLPNADALVVGQGAVMVEQASAPSTPPSGLGLLYAMTNGKVYFKNDAGQELLVSLNITVGTAAPSGGSDGDIYLQIL